MSHPDDLFGDMPTLPPTFEPTRDDDILAALMSGAALPADAPVETRLVSDLLVTLTGPGSAEEIAGLGAARRAFRAERAVAVRPGLHRLTRRAAAAGTAPRPRGAARLVVASVIGVLGLGGFAGAAFAGVLPDAVQNMAHALVGAPSADRTEPGAAHPAASSASAATSTDRTTGPDATGAAAYGLCTAYDRSRTDGANKRSAYEHSQAYRQLVVAAGGQENVGSYCATVAHPPASGSHPGGTASGPGPEGRRPTKGRPAGTGRPSTSPTHATHRSHPKSSSPTSELPSSTPASPEPEPGHPSRTKTPTKGPHSPQTKAPTRSPR